MKPRMVAVLLVFLFLLLPVSYGEEVEKNGFGQLNMFAQILPKEYGSQLVRVFDRPLFFDGLHSFNDSPAFITNTNEVLYTSLQFSSENGVLERDFRKKTSLISGDLDEEYITSFYNKADGGFCVVSEERVQLINDGKIERKMSSATLFSRLTETLNEKLVDIDKDEEEGVSPICFFSCKDYFLLSFRPDHYNGVFCDWTAVWKVSWDDFSVTLLNLYSVNPVNIDLHLIHPTQPIVAFEQTVKNDEPPVDVLINVVDLRTPDEILTLHKFAATEADFKTSISEQRLLEINETGNRIALLEHSGEVLLVFSFLEGECKLERQYSIPKTTQIAYWNENLLLRTDTADLLVLNAETGKHKKLRNIGNQFMISFENKDKVVCGSLSSFDSCAISLVDLKQGDFVYGNEQTEFNLDCPYDYAIDLESKIILFPDGVSFRMYDYANGKDVGKFFSPLGTRYMQMSFEKTKDCFVLQFLLGKEIITGEYRYEKGSVSFRELESKQVPSCCLHGPHNDWVFDRKCIALLENPELMDFCNSHNSFYLINVFNDHYFWHNSDNREERICTDGKGKVLTDIENTLPIEVYPGVFLKPQKTNTGVYDSHSRTVFSPDKGISIDIDYAKKIGESLVITCFDDNASFVYNTASTEMMKYRLIDETVQCAWLPGTNEFLFGFEDFNHYVIKGVQVEGGKLKDTLDKIFANE